VFAGCNLVVHYVIAHSYLPPAPFVDAVRVFDLSSSWSGEKVLSKSSMKALPTQPVNGLADIVGGFKIHVVRKFDIRGVVPRLHERSGEVTVLT
jgi:hypothetical protein